MTFIVIGHIFGGTDVLFNSVSAPIYTMQLGAAFFVFIAGWGMARTQKPRILCAYQRLFPILFYGGVCALLMSAVTWVQSQDLAESNYLPLFLGVNVFLNYFPANPTTWYIGMYIHLVLFWWLLMPKKPTGIFLLLLQIEELATRAELVEYGRSFTAYMMLSNWLGVFVLGYLCREYGDRRVAAEGKSSAGWLVRSAGLVLLWFALLLVWRLSSRHLAFDGSFPFRLTELPMGSFWVSALVTVVYLANTSFAFSVFRRVRAPAIVQLISRNTLLIFILHMPLIYALAPKMREMGVDVFERNVILVLLVLFGLSFVSELINRLVPLAQLQGRIQRLILPRV